MNWTLEQLTGALRHANINPDGYGERIGETRKEHVKRIIDTAEIRAIVEYDKRMNWPRIEAAQFDPLDFIPVQDMVREEI